MSKYAHVVKIAGTLINDGLLERIIKNHRHFYGVAVVQDDKIMLQHQKAQPSLADLKTIQEAFKGQTAVFAFGDVKDILDEDMQPICILKDEDNDPVCVVCLDGDFDRHRKSNESHIPEYTVAHQHLEKRIKKYADKGMSITGIIDELNDAKDDICLLWGEHGSITVLFSDGQIWTATAGTDKKGQYSWGFASNHYGYMEQVGGSPQVEEKSGPLDKLKAMMSGKTAPQNGTVVSQATQPPKTDTAVSTDKTYPPGTVLIKPDFQHSTLDTRKKQKSFYEDRLGYEPQQYKNAPPLLRIPQADGSYKWEMADTKSMGIFAHTQEWYPPKDTATKVEQTQTQQPSQPVQKPEPAPAKTDAVVAPAWLQSKKPKEVGGQQSKTAAVALPAGGNEQAQKTVPASVSTQRLPMLPPDQKQKVQEILKKTEFVGVFGENMKKIIDPKDLKKQIETEIPDFAKTFGLGDTMAIFDGWQYEQFFMLATNLLSIGKPDTLAKMMFDLRNYALQQKVANLTNPNIRNSNNKAAM